MSNKILIFHSSNDLYGASKILSQVIDVLNSKGFEIHIFLPYKGPLDKLFSEKGVKLNHLNFGVLRRKYFNFFGLINRIIKILISIPKITKYIKQNKIDIIYTNTSIILASGISSLICNLPNYVHIHEIPNNNFYSKIMGYFISNFSYKIIVVSKSVKNHWSKFITKPLTLIYNGIPKIKVQNETKHSSKKIRFLTVARLLPYKGHKYIIKLANELLKNNPSFEFVFLGDTFIGYQSYEDELKSMVKQFGIEKNILFFGFDLDVSKYMLQSDFLLHCAVCPDPLPTVIFEAIQHNLPVISTNIGGSVEILNNGLGGLLIPFDDVNIACEKISEYVFDEKLIYLNKKYSTDYVEKHFSEKNFNKNIVKIFNE